MWFSIDTPSVTAVSLVAVLQMYASAARMCSCNGMGMHVHTNVMVMEHVGLHGVCVHMATEYTYLQFMSQCHGNGTVCGYGNCIQM